MHSKGIVAHGGAKCSNIVSRSRERFDAAWAQGGAAAALSYLVKCHQLIEYFCKRHSSPAVAQRLGSAEPAPIHDVELALVLRCFSVECPVSKLV